MKPEEERLDNLIISLKKKEITVTEAKEELAQRGMSHSGPGHTLASLGMFASTIVIYLPTIAKAIKWEGLSYFTQFDQFDFPLWGKALVALFLLFCFSLTISASQLLTKKGGLSEGDESVIFLSEGPYRVMRHPIGFGFGFGLFILPPFLLSSFIAYTVWALIGQILVLVFLYLGFITEERTNLKKWGEQYQNYIKEVPRCNFLLGLWRLLRKRKLSRSVK